MRPFLALDTSTEHLAIGVGDLEQRGAVIAQTDMPAPRATNTRLLPAIERLLAGAGLEACSLSAIACGRGPGSFTGVRIGVATAKGLAQGAGVPLVGFSTLDAVAWRVWRSGEHCGRRFLGVIGDAMRGEVYPALFEVTADGPRRVAADRVSFPHEVAEEWAAAAEDLVLAGPALAKYGQVFTDHCGGRALIAADVVWAPDGQALLDAAWAAEGSCAVSSIAPLDPAEAYRVAHPTRLLPIYTRLSDAEEAERRAGAAGQAGLPSSGVAGPGDGDR